MWTVLIFLGLSVGNRVVRNRYEEEGRVAPFAVRHWITWTLIKMVALLTALAVVWFSVGAIMVHWHTWGPWVAIPTAIYLFVLFVRSRINDDRGHRERALANRQRIDGEQTASRGYIEGELATRSRTPRTFHSDTELPYVAAGPPSGGPRATPRHF